MIQHFVGIDIQTARPCSYAVLDASGNTTDAGWLHIEPVEQAIAELRTLLSRFGNERVAVGLDAPRHPLPAPRQWYWHGGRWIPRAAHEVGNGRHCEVVIAAHRLANPQFTPWRSPFPEWMLFGFALFQALSTEFRLHEVFPSASYAMFRNDAAARMNVRLGDFAPHPKDMLDAHVAAATVREFAQGRGCEVGGGDGLGTIVLPRPMINPITQVMHWPTGDVAIAVVP